MEDEEGARKEGGRREGGGRVAAQDFKDEVEEVQQAMAARTNGC